MTAADSTLREDEAHVTVTLDNGQMLRRHIAHALGSADNPMSDHDLERKFIDLAADTLPHAQTRKLIDNCWAMAQLSDVAELARLAAP